MAKFPRQLRNIDRNTTIRNRMIELCKSDRANFTKTKLMRVLGNPTVIDKYFMSVLREVDRS